MKAWILNEIGKIDFEDVERPTPSEGEVLVKVMAAGICGSDIPRIYDTGAHRMPLIPGHEFSGEVVEDKSGKWVGKKVGIFPLIPCKKCPCCQMKKYEMCQNYSYLGSRRDGGFAEYVSVPEWNLMELPETVDMRAAAMMEPMAVSVHALRRILMKRQTSEWNQDALANQNIVVCGLGTIGLLITMFLIDLGAKHLYVIGNKAFQLEQVQKLGLASDNYYDASDKDMEKAKQWILDKTNQLGTDYFLECVGRNETINLAIDCTAPAGSICMVGNPFSDMDLPRNTYWNILRKQLLVTGTWNSTYYGEDDPEYVMDDWHYVLNCLAKGQIHPEELITHSYAIEDLKKGFQIMHEKSEEYVKIMVVLK